jgi:exonuclease SbcC
MKSISSLHIRGFQSHVDTLLELHPGMNILIGPSDSGKTAIQRAIRWASHNEPLGDGYVNAKTGKASVSMALSDGGSVVRFRASGNAYEVNGQRLEGFGTRVPDEVIIATGMHKAAFGDDAIWLNYSAQLDAPFMLSETAGQSARMLGKIAGTEDLDLAGKLTNSDLIKERSTRSARQELATKLAAQLLDYMYLDSAEVLLEQAQALWQTHQQNKTQVERLRKIGGRLLQIAQSWRALNEAVTQISIPDLKEFKQKVLRKARADSVLKGLTWNSEQTISKKLVLHQMTQRIDYPTKRLPHLKLRAKLQQQMTSVQTALAHNYANTRAAEGRLKRLPPPPDLTKIRQIHDRERQCEALYSKIGASTLTEYKLQKELREHEGTLSTAMTQFEDYLTGLGICPVCQAGMDKERIHNHVTSLAGGTQHV